MDRTTNLGKRILVVDDEASVVEMCAKVLQGAGFGVEGVFGGIEAIERCQGGEFDLLLLDLRMPDLDGLEVLRVVKELDPDVAAIVITGYDTLESAAEAMRLGAQEYIKKPFDGDELVAAVKRVLDEKLRDSAVIKGNLRSMDLTSIVSINCNERNQARLRLRHRGREAVLFFKDGQIVHAALDSQEGEEVVYKLLTWEEGAFELEQDVSPPKCTMTTDWSGLLLEGLRRIDEGAAGWEAELGKVEAEEAEKTRDETAERLARGLKRMAGVEGALICSQEGTVLGQDTSGEPLKEAALTAFVGHRAEALGVLLNAGRLEQVVLAGEKQKMMIVPHGQNYVYLSLVQRTWTKSITPALKITLRRYQ